MLLEVLIKRVFREFYHKIKMVKLLSLPFLKISDKKLLKLFNTANKKQITQYFKERKRPKFFIDSKSRGIFIKKSLSGDQNVISNADEICSHVFDLLGSGKMDFGKVINWHCDFKSGKVWSRWLPHWLIRYELNKGFDIKVPWELSRFYHLPILAQAYNLTGKEKYFQEIKNQITNWIKKNPCGFGVNWKCPMEIAIRVCNWLLAFELVKAKIEDKNFKQSFSKSLRQHGNFIYSRIEKPHSNHRIACFTGLVYLGILYPEFKESEKWLQEGVKGLENEIRIQINEDGCDWENSIPYHRLVTELFAYPALLCKLNNIKLSDYFWEKLKKMFDFVGYYLKPDGKAPQIGDNDNGRLHILENYYNWQVNNHSYLFGLAKQIWPNYQPPIPKSVGFPESSYYIIRDNRSYMIMAVGEVGTGGIGNHKHNDILSFELQIDGKDFILDPGTCCYTPDIKMRNLFRSTAYHNTIVIDEKEQNRFYEDRLFYMESDTKVKINKWENTKDFDILDAEHSGYRRLKNLVLHRRQVIFNKKENFWIIKDILTGKGEHKFDLYFHFAPIGIGTLISEDKLNIELSKIRKLISEENFDIDKSLTIETKNEKSPNLFIIPLKTEGLSLEILDGWISPSYGLKVKAPVVKYTKIGFCPTEFTTILIPF